MATIAKIVKKWQSQNILGENILSESIQDVSKRISKRKSGNRKFFPLQIFFGFSHFFGQNGYDNENDKVKN